MHPTHSHALQLRQAKLAFPSVAPEADGGDWTPGVYLLVGVNSDEQCEEHKNRTVMTHAERCVVLRLLFSEIEFMRLQVRSCEALPMGR